MEINVAQNKMVITDEEKLGKAENTYQFENYSKWRVCFFWSYSCMVEAEILKFCCYNNWNLSIFETLINNLYSDHNIFYYIFMFLILLYT